MKSYFLAHGRRLEVAIGIKMYGKYSACVLKSFVHCRKSSSELLLHGTFQDRAIQFTAKKNLEEGK